MDGKKPTTSTDNDSRRASSEVEVSIVGSPEIFGETSVHEDASLSALALVMNTSTGEALLQEMSCWQWVQIDDTKLPAVFRNNERYVAVHMVQLKCLSKFTTDISNDVLSRLTMISHKMTLSEAWIFNSINALTRKYDLGCQLLSANDELVKLNDVQIFYWNVKSLNLKRIMQQMEECFYSVAANRTLAAIVMKLKQQVQNDLEHVYAELARLGAPCLLD
ncbi:unnamed protein product [Caenorhabditis auriculariae]|uniref:Uncharacterized protein n=1 Tax=Caenorhabditis auriculariae TaxID=2777116 RepID=A0A8S1HCA6_9PELO|nr:unnamed protein product [Caenorhabditis auriculariae]